MKDQNRLYWNQQFKVLQDTWPKSANFEECIDICLKLHGMVHSHEVSASGLWSFEDELLKGLCEKDIRSFQKGNQSIAWKLWHITRIEDMTMNVLIAGNEQLFFRDKWMDRLGTAITDTGNTMDERQIIEFSQAIDIAALKTYRVETGKTTKRIILSLKPEDLMQKVNQERLNKLKNEGAVAEGAEWLIAYWGRKTFAGLLLMPATRHNFVHLNESLRLKSKFNKISGDDN